MNQLERLRAKQQAVTVTAEVIDVKPKASPVANLSKQIERRDANARSEINRILDMEVIDGITDEQYEILNKNFIRAEEYDNPEGKRLLRKQAEALHAYIMFKGVFGPISVGGGKTLISLLIADYAIMTEGFNKAMLIIPTNLVAQLSEVDVPDYRSWCNINMPVHFITKLSAAKRMTKAMSGCRGLYVFTYDALSSPTGAEVVEAIAPEVIIADEAHNISSLRVSARAKRINNYIDEAKPRVVALSGTMSRNTPMEYWSISRQALGEYNFMPNIHTLAESWATAIGSAAASMDESMDSMSETFNRPLFPVISWARDTFPDQEFELTLSGFRKAFAFRLVTGPGVVSSGEDRLDIGINIINDVHPNPEGVKGWYLMQELIQQVKDEWVTPSGDELEYGMHVWKWLYELEGAGFYNELYWPSLNWLEKYRGHDEATGRDILARSQEYHEAHQEYSRELRDFITNNGEQGMDTPMLVAKNMSLHGAEFVGEDLFRAWENMHSKDFDERVERLKRAIRVCPFKIEAAVEFCKRLPYGKGAILWFASREVGKWLNEALIEAGLDVVYCPAGSVYNSIAIDPANQTKILVASIRAHGTGKNLQHFDTEYFVQWPRDAKIAEQSIGRVHRNGQKSDNVNIYTNFAGDFDNGTFSATLNDAAYIHQTLNNKQRLMYAEYTPAPTIVPYEVLKEWGAVKSGNTQSRDAVKAIKDKFKKAPRLGR